MQEPLTWTTLALRALNSGDLFKQQQNLTRNFFVEDIHFKNLMKRSAIFSAVVNLNEMYFNIIDIINIISIINYLVRCVLERQPFVVSFFHRLTLLRTD